MVNDPEAAELIARRTVEREREEKASGREVAWAPDVADWSLQHELLSQIRDTLIRVNSDKPKSVAEFPRPRTAVAEQIQRVRNQAAEDSTRDLVAQLTPWAVT